jgi:hypothetical protein
MNTPREDLQSMMNDAPKPSITVEIRDVYGKRTVYPICDTAKTFASIAGTTTLTDPTLLRINSLGYQINVAQRKIEI